MRFLYWIQKKLVISIFIGMIIGFVIGVLADDLSGLRVFVTPLSVLMVYPMMVTLNYRSLLVRGNVKLQLVTQMINFIYLPLLAVLFGVIFFRDYPAFRLGILLIALLPTSGMTVSWTVMAKGNVSEAIRMIVIGLILAGFITPLYIGAFMDASTAVPFRDIFRQIVFIVFVPMFLGFITQISLKKIFTEPVFKNAIKPIFPAFSTLAVVVLITMVVAMRAQMIVSNPNVLLVIILPIVLGYLVMLGSLHYIGTLLFNREDRIAMMNGTMIRSLSLALAIALTVFDEGAEVALVIAIAYMVQVQLAAWYVKRSMIRYKPVVNDNL